MSDTALAATSSLFLWSYAVCSPLAGYIGDRYSRSAVIVWSLAGWSLVILLTGLAQSATQLLALRIPLGIVESLYIPASVSLIADHHASATRGKAYSIYLCGFYTGVVAGGWLSGYLGDRYGWRYSLFALGAIGIVLATVAARVLHDRPPVSAATGHGAAVLQLGSVFDALRVPSYWLLLIEVFLLSTVTFIFYTWLPTFFHESYSLNLAMAGLYGTFALQVGGAVGVILGGWLSDLIARRSPRQRMLMQALCDCLSAPFLFVFRFVPSAVSVQIALFLFSFIRFMGAANTNPLTCDLVRKQHRSVAFGIMNFASCLAAGVGVLVTGLLKKPLGLPAIFVTLSAVVLVSGLMLLLAYTSFLNADLRRQGSDIDPTEAQDGTSPVEK